MLIKKEKEVKRYWRTRQPKAAMSTQLDNDPFDDSFFQHNLPQYYRAVLRDFRRITHAFVSFNILFTAALVAELVLFFVFLPFLSRSAFFAFALGGIFLTGFSYLVLLFYYQAKKPEQLLALKEKFLQSCKQAIGTSDERHLSIAEAFSKLAQYLQDFEWNFYQIPKILQPLNRWISRFSAYCYYEDVFHMKQLLLDTALEEHLKQIRVAPTDLEVHASLANTYIALSKLYREPLDLTDHPRAAKSRKLAPLFQDKFRSAASLAIEEFRILSHYAPNDPWVHEQLAGGYRDLHMPAEEIKEVETLLKLRTQDKEILFRLGALYFAQGQNAKGLQVYEELKQANFKKAEDLIASYGITCN